MERSFRLRARRIQVLWAAAVVCAAAAARAQDLPSPPLPGAVVAQPPPTPAPAPAVAVNRSIVMPAEKSSDIQTHWSARRDYLRDRDERRADDEEQHVRQLKDDLAIENLFFIGGALVRESHEALAAGGPALAVQRSKLAVEFSPALPEAHSSLARALLAENPGAVKKALDELGAAITTSMDDPRVSRAVLANVLGVLFAGLLVAGLAFILVLFARYANLYAHDVHHIFPVGARRWQTKMLAAVLLLLPVFLQMGPVPLILTVMLACALYATTVELVVGVALLCVLAASPYLAEGIGRVAAFGGPAVDVWLVEHGLGTGPEVMRLQKRLDASNELAVDFALARKAKRDGDLVTAAQLYLRALEAPGAGSLGLASVRNNLGNVYLLQGDTAKAIAQYQLAVELRENVAAPHFNVSRALGMGGGVETLEKVQSEQARALELDRAGVDAFTGGQLQANRKANKFVMDITLPEELLGPLLAAEERVAAPVGDELRAQLAGGLPLEAASALPILAAILCVALHLGRGRIRPSGRCERCGREVCKRCDPDARPSEALCAQCVNVFIRRTGVDAAERIRKEYAVQSYHRRRHAVARVLAVLSGAGHVMMGYPLRGMLYLMVTGSLVVSVVLWRGLLHDPIAVRSGVSFLRIGVTLAALVAIYAFCLRDLINRQRAEEGA
jgi:tetratricopeptide (TPR) repeat protein